MSNMRTYINLVEGYGSNHPPPEETTVNRIRHNAKVLQSDIKYLGVNPALQARLNSSMHVVVGYLDQL
jgi:hypothetical protein